MQSVQADDSTSTAPQLRRMLRAFPFRTFDEIAELGLAVEIYCPSCYHTVGPIDLADERLRGRFFANTRFRCSQSRRIYDASPPRECRCLGHIIVRPAPADFIPPHRSIAWCSITCPRCVPHWEVSQAAKHLPPWDKIWTRSGVQLACPACRAALTTTWYGGDGIPYTDGKRRGVTPLS
jgi:hypothetical protein